MTHLAIQEQFEGKTVNWMEKVSDEQYRTQQAIKPRTEALCAACFVFDAAR